jgi:tetratricopeptide (TPR) repeat protein
MGRVEVVRGHFVALMVWCVLASGALAQTLSHTGALLGAGRWGEAEVSARQLLEQEPGGADGRVMLGMALYHQGRYEPSVATLREALRLGTVYEARALYYLGLAESRCGRQEKASDIFMVLMMRHPDSPETQRLMGLSADVTVSAQQREGMDLSGTILSLEAGIDSNPDLIDGGDGDLLCLLYAYTDIDAPRIPFLIGASLLFEKYADLSENDFAVLAVNANDRISVGSGGVADWTVELSQTLLDYEAFDRTLSGTIEYSHPWRRVWVAQARATGALTDADAEGYDATRAALRFRGARYLHVGALRRVRVVGQWQANQRDSEWLAYRSFGLGADCRVELPWDVSLDLGMRMESRTYDGAHPERGVTREDDLFELSAFAVRPLRTGRYATGQVRYTTRDSSDDLYSADQFQLLFGLLIVR